MGDWSLSADDADVYVAPIWGAPVVTLQHCGTCTCHAGVSDR